MRMAFVRGLAQWYDRLNTTRPLATKSLTSALMLGGSDLCCQRLQSTVLARGGGGSEEPVCLSRAARMASWGLLVNGPLGHLFYVGLDRLVTLPGVLGIATKVAIDQAAWTPPLTMLFFVYEGCLQGEAAADASATAQRKLWPTLCANWTVWPLVHLCTFSVVPLNYRVLWVNCANFFWSGFLSLQAHDIVDIILHTIINIVFK